MPVFDLTPLTLGAKAQRRVVVKTFEMRWQVFVSALASLAAGLPLAMLLALAIGPAGLAAVPVCAVAAVWLFASQSSKGMQQTNFRTLADRAAYRAGQVKIAGLPFDPGMAYMSRLAAASARGR